MSVANATRAHMWLLLIGELARTQCLLQRVTAYGVGTGSITACVFVASFDLELSI